MSVVSAFGRAGQKLLAHAGAREPNLSGDRDVEWSWIAGRIPPTTAGRALDFGNGGSSLALAAAQSGYDVTAVDLGPVTWRYTHRSLRFMQGDILTLPLPEAGFDLVLNCSTVEHVGLAGRYDVVEHRPDGDLEAMRRLRLLMAPGALMLLTIPVGRDAVCDPYCRIYGEERLPRLLDGFDVEQAAYWVKNEANQWVQSDRADATAYHARVDGTNSLRNVYALGLFALRHAS